MTSHQLALALVLLLAFSSWLFSLCLPSGWYGLAIPWRRKRKLSPISKLELPVLSIASHPALAPYSVLMSNYAELFLTCGVLQEKRTIVDARVDIILAHQTDYEGVGDVTKIPWYCVAAIHSLECSCNFNCHLHNGDPLTGRTFHEPKGRPVNPPTSGHLPYTWRESAMDALRNTWRPPTWGITGCLRFLEHYNGLGYHKYSVNSPYLWACTNHYQRGLFTKDGTFDPAAVSTNIGGAALLKEMEIRGTIKFDYP